MELHPELVVCEDCDAVYRRRPLVHGEVARCSCCGAVLYRGSRLDVDGWLAMTVAAALAFALANFTPLIEIGLQGRHNAATLGQSVLALAQGAAAPVALVAGLTVIAVPGLQILLLLWVLGFARLGRRAPGLARGLRLLRTLRPWSMLEVVLLGVLVAIVKLAGLLDVTPGPGLWALGVLTLLITVVVNRDPEPLWQLDRSRPR